MFRKGYISKCLVAVTIIIFPILLKHRAVNTQNVSDNNLDKNEVLRKKSFPEYQSADLFELTSQDIVDLPIIDFIPNLKSACFYVKFYGRLVYK